MSDNLEIVMDIDTLGIFDVIDLDNAPKDEIQITENESKYIETISSVSLFSDKSACIVLFDVYRVFACKNLRKYFEDSS
ncbi:hypothetical protein C1H88_00145 [Streptococcus agalactiae]|nr:hypothetical protein C1H88_00145 [Streptococcus agalactiae]